MLSDPTGTHSEWGWAPAGSGGHRCLRPPPAWESLPQGEPGIGLGSGGQEALERLVNGAKWREGP